MELLSEIIALIEERENAMVKIEKVLFTRNSFTASEIDLFSVHSITMLYSLWEGFINRAFERYASTVNQHQVPFTNLHDSLVIQHMEKTFKQLFSYPDKPVKKIKYYTNLRQLHTSTVVPISTIVNTESNVSFDVLNRILTEFNLTAFPEFWQSYKHPKPNLKSMMNSFLKYRNGVAHGGDISSEERITQDVFKKYRNLVSDLMWEIYNKFEYGITNLLFVKPEFQHSIQRY